MAANIPWIAELAIFDETTPGTPPANAAAWQGQARVQFIRDSLSFDGLFPTKVQDMRTQLYGYGNEPELEGIRNGEFSFSHYLSGTGVTTSAGSQVSETALMRLVENWCGGLARTNSTAVTTGGSASAIDVDADTNFVEGACVAWEDPDTGECHVRRLVENTSGTTWSLDEDLPQACASADVIHGMATLYFADSVAANSLSSGRQLSYLLTRGERGISDLETWVCSGAVNNLTAINWNRNEGPTLDFTAMWSNLTLPNESPPTSISWSAEPVGSAPAVVGPSGRLFFQDYGTSTQQSYCLSSVSFNPGLTRTRTEIVTETTASMPGTCHFSFAQPSPEFSFVLSPWANDELTDYTAGTYKQWRTQAGRSAGFLAALGIPCATVGDVKAAAVNDSNARMVRLVPHLGTKDSSNNPFTTDTELTRAAWYMAIG